MANTLVLDPFNIFLLQSSITRRNRYLIPSITKYQHFVILRGKFVVSPFGIENKESIWKRMDGSMYGSHQIPKIYRNCFEVVAEMSCSQICNSINQREVTTRKHMLAYYPLCTNSAMSRTVFIKLQKWQN